MGNSVEYISYTCVLFSDSQGRAESGALLPVFFQKGGNGGAANFSSPIIGNFMVSMISS